MEFDGWFLVAQLFGVVTIVLEFVSYQIKNRRKYFLAAGISSLTWTLMFVFIGISTGMDTQISLIVAAAYSTVRALVFWVIFKYDTPKAKRTGRIFLIFMIAVALVAGTLAILSTPPEIRWLHILGFVTALLFVIGQYLPGRHYVRIAVVFYAAVVLLTQTPLNILPDPYNPYMFRWNIMGILIESSKIISVAVFYILAIRRKMQIKSLQAIKKLLARETHKVSRGATVGEIANLLPPEKLEALAAKMVRFEIATMDLSDMTDIKSSLEKVQAMLEDVKTIEQVQKMIDRVVELKKVRLNSYPVPKFSNFQDGMKGVILGSAKQRGEENE